MSSELVVLSTGGTIASTQDGDAATPKKEGSELVDAVPEISEYADVTAVRNIAQLPSFDMDVDTIADAADEAAADGADGVVVTHGTDTMEESAYLLDLTREFDVPVVFTGAQRRSDEVSPDGPANLLAAVQAASNERFRGLGGVYVAFDMELHAARDVTKAHTSALGTFESPDKGPVASFTREGIRVHRSPGSYSESLPATRTDADVAMIKSAVGVGAQQVEWALETGADGLVVEGTGLGNSTSAIGNAVADAIEAGVPVVVTSRCHGGSTAPVYGTDGGSQTLVDHGAIQAGDLPAHKARLKLALALSTAETRAEVAAFF
jgi:L-asparaginase